MNELEKVISKMDFQYFGTGQHKIDAESFLKEEDAVFLDVRAEEETETIKIVLKYHVPVMEIPLDELPQRLNELPRDKFIGIFCSSGVRSTIAFAYFKSKGFENVRIIEGGYEQLVDALKPGKVYKHIQAKTNIK